ncbi:hypothetical protein FHY09_001459 [Xanthomonas sp. 60]
MVGGSLSAGVLRNAVQTGTTQTLGTDVLNGPFRTNGGNRTVTLSFVRKETHGEEDREDLRSQRCGVSSRRCVGVTHPLEAERLDPHPTVPLFGLLGLLCG